MKILAPIILLILASCATGSGQTYCDLVDEEPTESYSVKANKMKRKTASKKKN